MQNRTNYHKKFPAGALKTVEEVLDLVIEARKERKAIRIWTVQQSGYLSCFYLISKTKLYRPGGKHPDPSYSSIDNVNHVLYPTVSDHSIIGMKSTNNRWFKGHTLLESYGIKTNFKNEHRMFTNYKLAKQYSEQLKNDPIYIEDVKRWHAYCGRLFSGRI